MSWLNKACFILPAVMMLSGCGFEPVYGTHEANTSHAAVVIPDIIVEAKPADITRKRLAQLYKAKLETVLNPSGDIPPSAPYQLTNIISETESAMAVSKDGTISRYNVVLQANLTLTRTSDNKVVYNGIVQRIGSYDNVLNAYYSTYISGQDAINRAAVELAEDVKSRMIAFFAKTPNPEPLPPAALVPPPSMPQISPLPNSIFTTSPTGLTQPVQ